MKKTFLFLFVSGIAAFAQPIGLGVKIGMPLTESFNTGSNSATSYQTDTKRYVFGPQLEIRFPRGVGFEVDALYTRLRYTSSSTAAGFPLNGTTTANSWEIPVLFKYKFGGAGVLVAAARPFFTAGMSFRTLTGVTQTNTFPNGSTISGTPIELRDRNVTGWVVGGGLELRALFLRFSPEIRYTHWNDPNFKDNVNGLLESNSNQAQLLLGIHF